jgi:REP element-mobilizing transposase RayT
MSRHLTVLLCTFALIAGCSRNPERSSAVSPTGPSAAQPGSLLGPTSVAPGGVSGKYDVSFPPRNDSFDFRNQLETKYATGLGRAAGNTYVDREGEVVWTQEYMRYRTNGCDHPTATQRVMTQIDGQPAGGVCGAPPEGLIEFPPRTESFDFRRQLEVKYQTGLNRGFSQSAVDAEGGVIWTQEYLRYRVNQCDHPTSVQKVFTQIDGGGVQPTCFVPPCVFTVAPTTNAVVAAGGTFTAVVTKTQGGDCTFAAESLSPGIVTIVSGGGGSTSPTTLTYLVAANPGPPRSMQIRIRWTNNSTLLQINQAGNALPSGFTLTDPNTSSAITTNCAIKTAATPCVLAVSGTVSGTATYTWAASYNYGAPITHNQSSSSPTFTFTQMCGGPGATPGGTTTPLEVTLMVTDGGITTTFQAGVADQPGLSITFFTCS